MSQGKDRPYFPEPRGPRRQPAVFLPDRGKRADKIHSGRMIRLTRLNGRPIVVNSENVEFIESTPDTTVCFTNGHRLVVRDSVDEVIGKFLDYRRSLHEGRPSSPAEPLIAGRPEAAGFRHDEDR